MKCEGSFYGKLNLFEPLIKCLCYLMLFLTEITDTMLKNQKKLLSSENEALLNITEDIKDSIPESVR